MKESTAIIIVVSIGAVAVLALAVLLARKQEPPPTNDLNLAELAGLAAAVFA